MIRDALSSRSWVLPDNCLRPQMSNWCHASVPTTPIQLQLWAWRQRYTIDNFCGPEIISPTYWTNSIGVTNFNSDQQEQSCLLSNKCTLGWEIGDEAPWPTSWQCTWWLSQIRAMASFTWAEAEPMSISTFEIRTWMQSQPHQRFCFKILNWKHLLPLELTCHDV